MNIRTVFAAIFSLSFLVSACGGGNYRGSASEAVPAVRLFKSADEALEALKSAVKSEDPKRVIEIFGEEGAKFIVTGDDAADALALRRFSARLDQRAELLPVISEEFANEQWYKLRFGIEGWSMRIPLVNKGAGWYFETHYAKEAVEEARREINEVQTIATLQEIVKAQGEYRKSDHDGDGVKEYATMILSTPGKQDGLYWKSDAATKSPLDELVAKAIENGYKRAPDQTKQSYEGYVYSILQGIGGRARGGTQPFVSNGNLVGGFAILAYPVTWNVSGAKTFVATPDGKVWKKDLGFKTTDIARDIKTFSPDWTWTIVDIK